MNHLESHSNILESVPSFLSLDPYKGGPGSSGIETHFEPLLFEEKPTIESKKIEVISGNNFVNSDDSVDAVGNPDSQSASVEERAHTINRTVAGSSRRVLRSTATHTAKLLKKIVNITTTVIAISNLVMRTALSITNAVAGFFTESKFVQDAVNFLKPIFLYASIGQIILAPLHLYQFGHGIYDVVHGEISAVDFVLNTVEKLSLFVGSMVTLLHDLATVALIPIEILKFLMPFDVLGIVLAAVSLISAARGWHSAKQFSKEFNNVIDLDKELTEFKKADYEAVIEFIQKQDPKRLKRITGKGGNDLMQRITQVSKKALAADVDEADELVRDDVNKEFTNSLKTLRGRVKSTIICNKLNVTASSVNLVANSVLFITPFIVPFCPVLAPVAGVLAVACYTVKGAAGCVSFSEFIYSVVSGIKYDRTALMKMEIEKADGFKPSENISAAPAVAVHADEEVDSEL